MKLRRLGQFTRIAHKASKQSKIPTCSDKWFLYIAGIELDIIFFWRIFR